MKRVFALIGIVVLAGGAAGFWFWQRQKENASADHLLLYGNVEIRQVHLAFKDSERIAALLVQEGERVRSGQLLGILDTRRFEASVAERAAQLAAQQQIVARLQAGNRPEDIAKARADAEAMEAELNNALLNFQRATNLVAQAVEPPQRADDARAALEVARARSHAARAHYDLMVLGPRSEDIAEAKARLEASAAALRLARQTLADASLYAPTNGVIENRLLEPGDMASPQKPVFTLALDDPVWVRAFVPETDLGKIRHGMRATVRTDSFPDKQYEGWVGFISPTAEFTPRTVETREVRTRLVYQVRVFVRNPQDELRLGMPAEITIPLDQPEPSGAAATPDPE